MVATLHSADFLIVGYSISAMWITLLASLTSGISFRAEASPALAKQDHAPVRVPSFHAVRVSQTVQPTADASSEL